MKVKSLKKYSSLFSLLFLITALAGTLGFGILPLRTSIWNKMRQIQELNTAQENRVRQIKQLPELEQQHAMIIRDEGILDILLTDDRVVKYVEKLEALATKEGVKLLISSQENGAITERKETAPTKNTKNQIKEIIVEDAPFDRFLRLSVTVRGEYQATMSFLYHMELLPYAHDVVGVEMVKSSEDVASSRRAASPFAILSSPDVSEKTEAPEDEPPFIATIDTLLYLDKAQ